MTDEKIDNLLDYFNGYEVQTQLMSAVSVHKKMKSLIAVTKIYTSMPSQVSYVVKYGDESKEFCSMYAALACYTGMQ